MNNKLHHLRVTEKELIILSHAVFQYMRNAKQNYDFKDEQDWANLEFDLNYLYRKIDEELENENIKTN